MANPGDNTVATYILRTMSYYLSKRAVTALYGQPALYEMAEKYPLPPGEGYTMNIPIHFSQDKVAALTEFTVVTPSATSAGTIQITVAGYGDSRIYSDFWRMVNSVPQQVTNDVDDMMRLSTKYIDTLCRSKISGLGTQIPADGATTANVLTATNLKARAIMHAGMKLADYDASPYDDGYYRGTFRPAQLFDVFANLSGGVTIGDYIRQTDVGAKKLEKLTVGVLGRVRILESTWGPRSYTGVGATSAAGLSVGATGYEAYVTGRHALFATDLTSARLKTYMKPPGSAGTADPIDQVGTVGVKFYFGAAAHSDSTQLGYRLMRIVSGTTW